MQEAGDDMMERKFTWELERPLCQGPLFNDRYDSSALTSHVKRHSLPGCCWFDVFLFLGIDG